MKNVVLLGSTGSIGTSTIKVAQDLPDQIRLVGLAAGGGPPEVSVIRIRASGRKRLGAPGRLRVPRSDTEAFGGGADTRVWWCGYTVGDKAVRSLCVLRQVRFTLQSSYYTLHVK